MLGYQAVAKAKHTGSSSTIAHDPVDWTQLLGCSIRATQPTPSPSKSIQQLEPRRGEQVRHGESQSSPWQNLAKIDQSSLFQMMKTDTVRLFSRTVGQIDSLQLILPEHLFLGMVCLERKRAERSRNKFLLLLLDVEHLEKSARERQILKAVVAAADSARRDTDPAGWYKHNSVLGIIFTELGSADHAATAQRLLDKVHDSLDARLTAEEVRQVRLSAHIFPDDSKIPGADTQVNSALYPDVLRSDESNYLSQLLKRAMDVVGSLTALLLLFPLYLLIAVAIKLTSKGPIFFQQERLGRFGTKFKCLKFRSMHAGNDPKIHQEFVKTVIAGWHDGKAAAGEATVYKMTNDPRITRIGRVIRRTSLDELPQFINVLKGDMSLVGPRPPLPYEFEEYDFWHRRRVLEAKPGITGLWQVKGRSRVRFDDMVRLDLQYASGWSLWLDIQILAQTPRAVLLGDGAY